MKIWGNGGILISDILGVYYILFNNAQCKLSFKQQSIQNITLDTKIHRTNVKFRPYITAIITVCNGDEANLQQLMMLINDSYSLAGTADIVVYPRYNEDNSQYIYYYCVLQSSNIQPKNYANTKVGQQIQLVFKGTSNGYMPYFTSETAVYNIVDESNNQYVDASDNNYIMYR